MKIKMNTTGQRIKHLRVDLLKLSQEGLGKIAEVSKAAVSQWERELTSPEADPLLAMQRNKNINPEWIKNGKGEIYIKPQPVHETREGKGMYVVTPDNAEFLKLLKQLDDRSRNQLLIYMEGLLAGQNSRTELDAKTPHTLPAKNEPTSQTKHEEK